MNVQFKKWLWGAACALAACLPLASQAEPYFTNKEGDQIWDKATNLVWQRCSVGQTWNGKTCAGDAKEFNFDDAQKQAGNGWRVPTIRELASLIYCEKGQTKEKVNLKDGGADISSICQLSTIDFSTINLVAFPATRGTYYWSSSPVVGSSGSAWYVRFYDGYVAYGSGIHVRLVRASQLSGSEAASDFTIQLESAKVALNRIQQEKADAARRAEEERQAAERRADEAKRSAIAALVKKGPQQLYLLAGQSQRGQSVEINGHGFGATTLYELIIEKFPSSEFAVKATDQLSAMGRAKDARTEESACSGKYVGQRVYMGKAFGLAVYGEVLGVGKTKMSVRVLHPSGSREVEEHFCNAY